MSIEPADPGDPVRFYGALEAADLALIVFTRRSCGACRVMKRALLDLPDRVEGRGPLRVFEVDVEDGAGLVEDYGVFHLPALFLWRGGEYHARVEAQTTAASVLEQLRRALERPAEEEP